jgi:hypothetical protein
MIRIFVCWHVAYMHDVELSILKDANRLKLLWLNYAVIFQGDPWLSLSKTFANRSGNVMRKFSTLLRRGKRNSKTLSSASFHEPSLES